MSAVDVEERERERKRRRSFYLMAAGAGVWLGLGTWFAFRNIARVSTWTERIAAREFEVVAFFCQIVIPSWYGLLAPLVRELLQRERVPDRTEVALAFGSAVPLLALPLAALAWAWRSGWNPGNAVAIPVSIGVGAWTAMVGGATAWRLLEEERRASPTGPVPATGGGGDSSRAPGRGDAPVPTWTALAILLAGLAGLFGWAWCRLGGCPGAEEPFHRWHADLVLFIGLIEYALVWTLGIESSLLFSGRRGHEVDLGEATAWFWSRVVPAQVFVFFAVIGAKYGFFARIAVLLAFAWVALASILATRKMLAATRPRRS